MRIYRLRLLASACVAGVIAQVLPAIAQNDDTNLPTATDAASTNVEAADVDTGTRRLGSIVVTAQKKEETLQSAPLAVSAFDTESLELRQIEGPQQLQFNVPSLVFAQLTGYTQLSMRGIGSDLTVTAGEPTVATFQDGVYVGQLFTQAVPGFDLERIEVLRGPQGTLYGRNATGGTINYITKLPDYDYGANLVATLGDYNRRALAGGVTGTLIEDKLAGRLTIKADKRDGYRRNVYDGRDYDDNDQFSAQGTLLFDVSPNIQAVLRVDKTRQVGSAVQQFIAGIPVASGITPETPVGIFSLPGPALAGIPGLFSAADLALLGNGSVADFYGLSQPGMAFGDPTETTDFANDFPSKIVVDMEGISGTVTFDLDSATLKSITAYRESDATIRVDNDGSSASILYTNPISQSSKQFTQELTLSGESADSKLDWLVGGFYYHDEALLEADLFLPSTGELITLSGSLTSPTPPPVFDLSQPFIPNLLQLIADPVLGTTLNVGDIPATGFLGFGADQTSKSAAIYGHATYSLNDRLRASAGLRYTEDDKEVLRKLHSNFVPAVALCDATANKTWDALTGSVGVDYDVNAEAMIYAKASRGYKAGGFNPGECSGSFDPEFLWSYEAGFKSTFANNQALLNLAAFYYDFTDIQFTTYTGNASTIKNASAATLYGLEVEYVFRPDGFEGFQLDGSGSYIHSEYDDQLLQDPLNTVTLDIGGNQLIRAPEWKLNFAAQYETEIGNLGTFLLRGESSYTSETFHDVFNGEAPFQAGTAEPSYWISNARLIWRPQDTRFEAQLFVENIGDELYAYSRVASATTASVIGQFSPPRTFGVRLSMKLGSAR